MANPSLQIGNSNWAIKEDNLLGYSTAGTRFVPQPITMTRASAGTRVNSSGLVETVELLGNELVSSWTNNDFSSFASSGSDITQMISSGSGNNCYSLATFTSGKTYKLEFTSSQQIIGQVRLSPNTSLTSGVVVYSNPTLGKNEIYFTPSTNYSYIGFYASTSFTDTQISAFTVKEYAANNLARVDYDGTASSLLVEPMRTNLATYSKSFGSGKYFSTYGEANEVSSNNTSPSGTENATQIISTGQGKLYAFISLPANTTYSLSFYAKNVDATEVQSRILASGGSGGSNMTAVSYISQLSTTEWTKITHIFTTNSTAVQYYVFISNALNIGGNIQIWGAQLEEGSYATSYIPTDGGTVTRVQDQYSKTGISNLINSEEGVLFVEAKTTYDSSTSRRITLSDGSISNRVSLEFDDSVENKIKAFITLNGASEVLEYTAPDLSIFNKIAIKWKANDFAVWFNGSAVVTETAEPRVPTGMTQLSFDGGNGANFFYGEVKQLQVYKTADIDLAALTS